jgi:hypothetical protein
MYTALCKFKDLQQVVLSCLNSDWTLNICSLGGGPGSELLGLAKYAERLANGKHLEVEFTIVDQFKEWDESWNCLKNNIELGFVEQYGRCRSTWPVRISHSFLPLKLCDPAGLQHFPIRFAREDVFVLNFVVSEMRANPAPLREFVRLLSERTEDAAYFLFIDRQEPGIPFLVEKIIEDANLVVIDELEQDCVMDYDEQKTALGRWRSDLDREPKLQMKAFYRLATINPDAS